METTDSTNSTESRQRKRVKGRCPLRGCRGGVSPCAGPGGSPGGTQETTKKEKKKREFPSGYEAAAMETQIRPTLRNRASGKGSRGDAPCAGLRLLQGNGPILQTLRRAERATSSDLAALGHLPQRGRLCLRPCPHFFEQQSRPVFRAAFAQKG